MLQQQIDTIVTWDQLLEVKLNLLQNLFQQNAVMYFADLDDTISQHHHCFYSKIRFFSKSVNDSDFFEKIISDFQVNPVFLQLVQERKIQKICIISRNNHFFVRYFIEATRSYFKDQGIDFVGWIGRVNNFQITSLDKLNILSKDSILISDIFEYRALKNDLRFVPIDKFSWIQYVLVTIYKFFWLTCFSIMFLINKIWR